MSNQQLLQQKIKNADEVASLVNSGDTVDYGFGLTQPDLFDEALAAQKDRLTDVIVRATMTVKPRRVIEDDQEQAHFEFQGWHFSGYDRKKSEQGLASYIPFNFGEGPEIYRNNLKSDMLVLKTSPMDEHGYFNFGVSNTFARASCDVAKKIVVETSNHMPVCYGTDNAIHISEIDAVIEGDNAPLFELPSAPIGEIDKKVASFIVPLIEDRSCIQIGIGGMPNAVCSALVDSDIKDLGIHTEMFVDGMVDLYEAGKVSGKYKQTHHGKIVYTFALGSKKMYEFIHKNELCVSIPVDDTNLPENIAANDKVVSINNCLQVDLTGQVASESNGYRHISGTGGQLQFVRGAVASKGGKSFMCLSSRFIDKKGNPVSRIVPGVTPGTVITTPRTDIMYVVTEYGVVNLKGKSVSERALSLISIAHPDDREQLHQQACENKILSKKHW
ncbi:MAG: 4-hydroxybutyrate CoA-transferase [Cycloclasticus sp. symbiont of Poecilosclerida sp. M]|nr:MAG: 4-hydroxybutyrate CoA-transferase [Cycloclasticus sp. symbiont of Poecilosclerida sp. M]